MGAAQSAFGRDGGRARLSTPRQVDEPNDKPDGLEESRSDHQAPRDPHAKPEDDPNESAKQERRAYREAQPARLTMVRAGSGL